MNRRSFFGRLAATVAVVRGVKLGESATTVERIESVNETREDTYARMTHSYVGVALEKAELNQEVTISLSPDEHARVLAGAPIDIGQWVTTDKYGRVVPITVTITQD